MCWTITIGTVSGEGIDESTCRSACGPPVEAPSNTTEGRSLEETAILDERGLILA